MFPAKESNNQNIQEKKKNALVRAFLSLLCLNQEEVQTKVRKDIKKAVMPVQCVNAQFRGI